MISAIAGGLTVGDKGERLGHSPRFEVVVKRVETSQSRTKVCAWLAPFRALVCSTCSLL